MPGVKCSVTCRCECNEYSCSCQDELRPKAKAALLAAQHAHRVDMIELRQELEAERVKKANRQIEPPKLEDVEFTDDILKGVE